MMRGIVIAHAVRRQKSINDLWVNKPAGPRRDVSDGRPMSLDTDYNQINIMGLKGAVITLSVSTGPARPAFLERVEKWTQQH